MKKPIEPLQFITMDPPHDLSHAAQARLACEGGVKWVQFRSKVADENQVEAWAREVQSVCSEFSATFIINDRVELAKQLDADGVHVGLTDMPVPAAREILGDGKIIGATTNTFEDIQRITAQQPDYFGLGPLRFTATKDKLSPMLGFAGFEEIVNKMKTQNIHIPLIAIGGIVPEDLRELLNVGVYGFAVASGISKAQNPSEKAELFLSSLT